MMTILHLYVDSATKTSEHISKYLVTRDPADLDTAVELLRDQRKLIDSEIDNPSLQDTTLCLCTLTSAVLNARILADNSLTLSSGDYISDNAIESGKFIRVKAIDQEPETVFLCKVTYFDGKDVLVLAPVVEPVV